MATRRRGRSVVETSSETMPDSEAFRLSRIYAEGWNAANRLATNEVDALDIGKVTALNPYSLEADRSRWMAGFTQALATERPVVARRQLPIAGT